MLKRRAKYIDYTNFFAIHKCLKLDHSMSVYASESQNSNVSGCLETRKGYFSQNVQICKDIETKSYIFKRFIYEKFLSMDPLVYFLLSTFFLKHVKNQTSIKVFNFFHLKCSALPA